MACKKIVLVIVEGPSDDVALGIFLEKIYDKCKVHVHITHCDLTTEKGACFSTIHIKPEIDSILLRWNVNRVNLGS